MVSVRFSLASTLTLMKAVRLTLLCLFLSKWTPALASEPLLGLTVTAGPFEGQLVYDHAATEVEDIVQIGTEIVVLVHPRQRAYKRQYCITTLTDANPTTAVVASAIPPIVITSLPAVQGADGGTTSTESAFTGSGHFTADFTIETSSGGPHDSAALTILTTLPGDIDFGGNSTVFHQGQVTATDAGPLSFVPINQHGTTSTQLSTFTGPVNDVPGTTSAPSSSVFGGVLPVTESQTEPAVGQTSPTTTTSTSTPTSPSAFTGLVHVTESETPSGDGATTSTSTSLSPFTGALEASTSQGPGTEITTTSTSTSTSLAPFTGTVFVTLTDTSSLTPPTSSTTSPSPFTGIINVHTTPTTTSTTPTTTTVTTPTTTSRLLDPFTGTLNVKPVSITSTTTTTPPVATTPDPATDTPSTSVFTGQVHVTATVVPVGGTTSTSSSESAFTGTLPVNPTLPPITSSPTTSSSPPVGDLRSDGDQTAVEPVTPTPTTPTTPAAPPPPPSTTTSTTATQTLGGQAHAAQPTTPEDDPTSTSQNPVTPTQDPLTTITPSVSVDPDLFTGSVFAFAGVQGDGGGHDLPDRAKRSVPLPTSIAAPTQNLNSVPTTSTSAEEVASHHAIFKLVGRQEEGVVCVAAVDGVDTGPITSSLTVLLSQSGTITTIVTAVVVTPPTNNPTAAITTEITLVTSSAGVVETYVATATITPPAPPVSYTPVTIVTVVNGTSSTIVTDARVSTLYPVDLSTTMVYTTTSSGHLATITTIENLADVESVTVVSAPPVSSTFSVPPLRITLDYPSSTTTTSRSGASLLSPISGRVFFLVFGVLSGFVVGFVL